MLILHNGEGIDIQEGIMLENPEERIILLKAGFTGKTIEKLYIKYNNFKIVCLPVFIELVELNSPEAKKICINHEVAVECA